MALPTLAAVQRDFSAGQVTNRAARRDDLKIQRSALKRSVNTRPLASGALAQRFGRSAYNLDNGRTEVVRFSDSQQYEFTFTENGLRIRDKATQELLNDFSGLPWTVETLGRISMAQTEREVVCCYDGFRPKLLSLGTTTSVPVSSATSFGDLTDNAAYPIVAATNTSSKTSGSSHAVSLPVGIQAGDLLIVAFSVSGETATTPSGWTLLSSNVSSSQHSYIWYKVASGAEGGTVTVSLSGGDASVHATYRITGFSGVPEAANVLSEDPPNLTPSWGSAKTLWLALLTERNFTPSAAPSNFDGLVAKAAGASNGGIIHVAGASRQYTGSSLNPGTFSGSGSAGLPIAFTVAVRPVAGTDQTANAFDGETNKASSQCVSKNSATSAYVGLDLSANPVAISGVTVYGSNDQGFVNGANPNVTITLYGKNGSAPANATDGTSLGTNGATADTANESAGRSITSSDQTTEYDYVWVTIAQAGSAATMYVAQVAFTTPGTASADDSWLLNSFMFDQTPEGAKLQPYVRYATRGIAMSCSARSGAITLAFDGPVLDPGHVGVSFRFHEREIIVTGVTDARNGTANVVEKLPPSLRVTCATANGRDSFKIGQVVIGQTSGAEGIITGFNSTAKLDIIVYKGSNYLDAERIASGTGSAVVSGTPTENSVTLTSTAWDEAAMSDFRGWPRSASYDRSRLILCDFPQAPRAIAWSAIGTPQDMYIGADADDGFLEFVPGTGRVLHVVGGADQFVLTDVGVQYIPISESNPLQPGSVSFRPIAAIGANAVQPVAMQEAVVYTASNGKSLIGIIPTGQTAFPYRTTTLSEFHADLFIGVLCLAAMSGGGDEAEQYLWVGQSDGTALVGKYDVSNQWVGFVPVAGDGVIKWLSALGAEVRFNVQYQDDDSPLSWTIELLDETQFVDGAVPLNSSDPSLRPGDDDGSLGRLWMYAGLAVEVMDGETFLGTRTVDEDGNIVEEEGDDFTGGDVVAGFGYEVTIEPFLPSEGEGDDHGQRRRLRSVKEAYAVVQDTTEFKLMGRTFGGASPGDGTFRAPGQGRAYEPVISLSKTKPGPFTLVELGAEVTT